MDNNKKRLNLRCAHDPSHEYSYLVDLGSTAKLTVECPFCRKKATLDLAPYRKPYDETQRDGHALPLGEPYIFPDEPLPTSPPGDA
jgi:hypothetical protein